MRFRQRVLTGVLAILLLAGFTAPGAAQAAATTLQSAAARGLVEYSFEGTGASSGDSVRLKVKRSPRAPDPLPITIPPGTILRSGGAGQTMVVSVVRGIDVGGGFFQPTARLVLNGSAPVTAILSAFCAEFEKDNPSASTPFTLEPPDPTLACVLTRSRNLSVATQQAAVWMYTDHLTYQHMNEKFSVSPAEWAAAEPVVRACTAAAPQAREQLRPSPNPPPAAADADDLFNRFFGTAPPAGGRTQDLRESFSAPEPSKVFGEGEDAIRQEVGRIRAGVHGDILPVRAVPATDLNGLSRVTVKNSSAYNISVLLSGPVARRLEIAPGETQTTILRPGNYEVAASVSSATVVPFYGTQFFSANSEYREVFFVGGREARLRRENYAGVMMASRIERARGPFAESLSLN